MTLNGRSTNGLTHLERLAIWVNDQCRMVATACLKAGRRLLFNVQLVEQALLERSQPLDATTPAMARNAQTLQGGSEVSSSVQLTKLDKQHRRKPRSTGAKHA